MKPGIELDALIEANVFGTPKEAIELGIRNRGLPPQIGPVRQIRYVLAEYSTDISAAWEVVEKLMERGEKLYIGCDPDNHAAPVSVSWPVGESVEAKTLPHAICLAAVEITNSPRG